MIPLVLLALILGLPAVLIVLTAHRWSYVAWMLIYLLSLPVWNFVLPTYAFWKFDDFSWGDTRKTDGEKLVKKAGIEYEGEFDSSKITMKRWGDFESGMSSLFLFSFFFGGDFLGNMWECIEANGVVCLERRMKAPTSSVSAGWPAQQQHGYNETYHDM